MESVTQEGRWAEIRERGEGFVFNDFSGKGDQGKKYNVLHRANCPQLGQASTSVEKSFSMDLEELLGWLNICRRGNWKPCGSCCRDINPETGQAPKSLTTNADRGGLLLHLRDVARQRGTTTYGVIADRIGLDMSSPYDRKRIGAILGELSEAEHCEGRPLISALVVSSDTMIPGSGFFELARRLGVPGTEDRDAFHLQELRRVHDYWSGQEPASSGQPGS